MEEVMPAAEAAVVGPGVVGSRPENAGGPSQGEASQSPVTPLAIHTSAQNPASIGSQLSVSAQRGRGRRFRGQHQAGQARGAARNNVTTAPARRAFGGHLTGASAGENGDTAATVAALSADAPEFVPGQPVTARRCVLPLYRMMCIFGGRV